MEEGLGKGKQGRYGTDPVVEFESLGLWRFSGLSFERLSLQLGSRDPDPGPTVDFDELNLRVGLLSLLSEQPEIIFDAALYEGDVDGEVTVTKRGELKKLALQLEDVNIAKMPILLSSAGVPSVGKIQGNIDLNLGKKPSKDAKGRNRRGSERAFFGARRARVTDSWDVWWPNDSQYWDGRSENKNQCESGQVR